MDDDEGVIDLALRTKTGRKKRPGRAMKETPADEAVRGRVLENSGRRLLEIVEGLEDLADRIGTLREDVRQRLGAAKSEGYSTAAIKHLIKKRAATPEAIAAQAELALVVDTYEAALGAVE